MYRFVIGKEFVILILYWFFFLLGVIVWFFYIFWVLCKFLNWVKEYYDDFEIIIIENGFVIDGESDLLGDEVLNDI